MTVNTEGRLIFVTGTPGTGVGKSLEKFVVWRTAAHGPRPDASPQVIKLEDRLKKLATDHVRQCLQIDVPMGTDARLFDVLCLPKPVLYPLWVAAFEKCISDARLWLSKGVDVFLTFHACWYHLGNQEYIYPVDFAHVSVCELRPTSVITLIDDIYDVRSRLGAPGEVLHPEFSPGFPIVDSILKLFLVLEWRAFETAISERIAAALQAEHFVFAVKHPLRTFENLVYSDQHKLYLSHHISELRRLLQGTPASVTTAKGCIGAINDLARYLRESAVLLEPTTIDEARLAYRIRTKDRDIVLPKLFERWPLAELDIDALLYVPPVERLPEFGPAANELATRALSGSKLRTTDLAQLEDASVLLDALSARILSQINARDHFLVEHVDGVIVYRPYMLGHEASGVMEELAHHHRLVRAGVGRAAAIILHPPEDERIRPKRMAQKCLKNWRIRRLLVGDEPSIDGMIHDFPTEVGLWAALDFMDPIGVACRLTSYLTSHKVRWAPLEKPSALQPAAAVREQAANKDRGEDFLTWANKNYLDGYRAVTNTLIIEEDLSPQTFASRVFESLQR